MTQLWQFVALLGIHWIADFVCQTHWQASNKSKDVVALTRHVASYTAVLAVGAAFLISPWSFWVLFVLLNGTLHWLTDYFTSRWTSALWAKQDWHNFFVVIGLDQLIHAATLAFTLWAVS